MRFVTILPFLASLAFGASERIRINQVGYLATAPKFAIALDSGTASLIDSATGSTVLSSPLGKGTRWSKSGDTGRIFEFSAVKTPGTYYVTIGVERSHPVRIAATPFLELERALIKAYWYQRASYAPAAPWAGPYTRSAGHPDTAVLVHASAAGPGRPKGTKIRSPGGWYDAGDYGKYVVNSGITMWILLRLYETSPAFFDTLRIDVPAHAAPISDLLDEVLWNLRWMLTMQDPGDGGVYHKLTTAQHAQWTMPDRDRGTRYAIQKSTAATLDLAATAAFASRLLEKQPGLAGLSDSCRAASLSAWRWARANPDSIYDQDTLNEFFSPSIGTGTYDDANLSDEFLWAGSELSLLTGSDSFAVAAGVPAALQGTSAWPNLGWENVGTLGRMSLAAHPELLPGTLAGMAPTLDSGIARTARALAKPRSSSPYHLPAVYFWWGSAGYEANIGLVLWEAWRATGDTSFRNASLDALDYVLGRNATGYGFVTGFGAVAPLRPHNRITESDGVVEPIPGLVVGGPNATAAEADGCTYPSELEAKVYVDDVCSYSTNENSINQAAPVTYLAGVWSATGGAPAIGVGDRADRSAPPLRLRRDGDRLVAEADAERIVDLRILAPDGSLLASASGGTIGRIPSGLFVVRARTASGRTLAIRCALP